MKTAAFAIALLLGGAAFAQTSTTTTTQPDVDVDAHVGMQPDGDPDVDLDVDAGTKTKTMTVAPDGTAVTTSTSTTDGASDGPSMTTGTTTVATNVTPPMNPVVQPSNAAPERDARGIAVISDPAVVPAGFNGTTGSGVGGPMIDPATGAAMTGADTSHPACTRTLTDNCVQTYERGRKR